MIRIAPKIKKKHSSLFVFTIISKEKRILRLTCGACIIKLITSVIYRFRNKLDKAGKACQGKTQANFGNCKLWQ
jgi:hypothetical protein